MQLAKYWVYLILFNFGELKFLVGHSFFEKKWYLF